MQKIKGVIPPMLTPFTETGELDLDAHLFNVDRWNAAALRGYLVLGSNSEAAYLTENEKLDLIRQTVQAAAPGRMIMVGTGMESTRETIRLTNLAAKEGAHAALLLTPAYYIDKMSDSALLQHFTTVADQADIPILIYNVPKYTHLNVSVNLIAELSQHPNIMGMKDSSGNVAQLVQFQAAAAPDFNILVGTVSIWYPALLLGVRATITALANLAPDACVRIQTLVEEGQLSEAEALYRRVFPLNHAVTGPFGVAGLKYAANLLGYKGGFVRSPLQDLDAAGRAKIEAIVAKAQPL
ncbi:MAG: dihydrodipicolinate synthase family protein [Lewinellaceae bacterium]|nr:dihydrodipicolinate synthase family protein [Lewinellaceae bacterium]